MSDKAQNKTHKQENLSTPKNFMIPIMLLHLKDMQSHGYELMDRMLHFGIESIDQGNFYRLLRQLEKDNLVSSEWDVQTSGPAKRIYRLTDAGEQYLDVWASSLEYYQKMLNGFFSLYNPFFTPPSKNDKNK